MMRKNESSPAENPLTSARSRRLRLFIILTLLLAIVPIMNFTGCAESTAFYFPTRESFVTPKGFEDVTITTPDGVKLHAWFMPAHNRAAGAGPAPAVIHCHGNAGNISSHEAFSRFLPHSGVSVLIFDYRGYGRSEIAGRLNRAACMTDTLAAYDYLKSRKDVDTSRIGAYGVSLGGAFALQLAADHPEIRSICTVSAFTSFPEVASDHVPILASLLIRRGLDGSANAARLGNRSYLIVHGDRDDIIPPAHATRLAAAARSAGVPVEVFMVSDAGHNDVLFMNDEAKQRIAEFFTRTLSDSSPSRTTP